MYSDVKKKAVRRAYVVDNKPVTLVAEEYDVPERTLWNWKKAALRDGDDWDKERAVHALGDGEQQMVALIVPMFMRYIGSTMEKLQSEADLPAERRIELLARLTDSLTKTTSALRKLNPEMDKLALGVQFLNLLTKFVAEHYPQHASPMQEILEPFGKVLLTHLEA